ncbi:MAG: hypothetical protein P1U84_12215 [Parvibaculaceae bacterium]|nr:hypothetical protein [Parvibaculaceae bacterium]
MRPIDWEARLVTFLQAHRDKPFAPGTRDCVLMAADWLVELGHEDPAAAFRGRYRCLMGGYRAMRKAGFQNVGAAVTSVLGPPSSHVIGAARGDIAAFADARAGLGHMLGVVTGAQVWCPAEGRGLVALPLKQAEIFWTV